MAFKKLDSDAVSSSDGRALDAFILQGEAANYAQADEDRGRSIGQAYTAERGGTGTATRPVLASPSSWASCVPLGAFPISPECRQLTIQVRGVASAPTGKTAAVELKVLLQKIDGTVFEEEATVTVNGSASAQTVDLTIATDSVQGQTVVVWLYFVSERSAALDTASHGRPGRPAEITLNHLTFVYDAAKRYSLTFAEDSSGGYPRDDQGYPGEVMINRFVSGQKYRIIPAIAVEQWEDSSWQYDISIYELGRFEVYGWSVTESAFDALPDLAPMTRPGGRLRARTDQEMYRRGYHLTTRRTRLFSAGASTAQLVLGASNQVNLDPWSVRTSARLIDDTRDIYVSLVGALPTFQVQASSATPTTEYRRRYRVMALMAMATSQTLTDNVFRVRCAVQINSFGGGPSWGGSTVTPTITTPPQAAAALVYDRGEVTAMSMVASPAADFAYRWWAYSEVVTGNSGLRLFEFTCEEATAQQAVTERLFRIRFNVQTTTAQIPEQLMLVCPGATIMVDEGF